MARQRMESGKAIQVLVDNCNGDLVARGWSEAAVEWSGHYEVTESDKGYRFTGSGDLRLYLPAEATLWVETVSGDVILKRLSGDCVIDSAHGDVVLSDLGTVQLNTVHGDLVVRGGVAALTLGEVHGDVSARQAGGLAARAIRGDFAGRHIDGPVSVEEASGDVALRGVAGDVTIAQAHRDVNVALVGGAVSLPQVAGDIRLRGPLPAGDHLLDAKGDIVVRWPADAPVNVMATARRIDNRLPLTDVVEKEGSLAGQIGSGQVNLTLVTGQRIILKEAELVDEKWRGFEPDEGDYEFDFSMAGADFAAIGARIEAEVNNHVARLTRDIETRFGPDFGQRIADKVARQAEKAAERAERATERVRRKGDGRGRFSSSDFASPAPAPRKSASPEEQLKILKMVESGTISPEEAGMLLEALDN